jgi:hypothetical protein
MEARIKRGMMMGGCTAWGGGGAHAPQQVLGKHQTPLGKVPTQPVRHAADPEPAQQTPAQQAPPDDKEHAGCRAKRAKVNNSTCSAATGVGVLSGGLVPGVHACPVRQAIEQQAHENCRRHGGTQGTRRGKCGMVAEPCMPANKRPADRRGHALSTCCPSCKSRTSPSSRNCDAMLSTRGVGTTASSSPTPRRFRARLSQATQTGTADVCSNVPPQKRAPQQTNPTKLQAGPTPTPLANVYTNNPPLTAKPATHAQTRTPCSGCARLHAHPLGSAASTASP